MIMNISENTMQILKNYGTINPNFIARKGNTITTVSEAKNILSSCNIEEQFEQDMGIYDLNEFLNVLSLVDQPKLDMEEKWCTVKDATGRSKVKYFFTDSEMLTTPTEKMIENASNMTDFAATFDLDNETLSKVKRAAGALGHSSMKIEWINDSIQLTVFDTENPTSNSFTIEVPGSAESNGNWVININNLKIVPGDYEVKVSNKNISNFIHKEKPIQYWIALEK
tara:strand:- start:348 stop:1022 length:675 start_codon:yes stop_codon:yes gene_type:complete